MAASAIPAEMMDDETLSKDASHAAVRVALLFAALKLALHVGTNLWQAHLGWGYFRDEFYYILCGQNLDWGYVDHGPIVALQARLALLLFGKSLAGIRMFAALAGATKVFLTGMLAWQMGARRAAQALAMGGVLLAPEFMGLDSFLSMNTFEPVFWMIAAFAILRLLDHGSARWWIVFGVAAGLGMENKASMLVYLAALLLGLLLTPQRRILFSRAMLVAVGIAFLLVLPNLLWQIHHHWATLEFLRNGKRAHKNLRVSPPAFLLMQIFTLNPLSLPLWGGGLVWLMVSERARRFRFLGWTYLIFFFVMMATRDALDYYIAPIYPFLFAAGGCAWERLTETARTRWILPAYVSVLTATAVIALPLAIPVLTPRDYLTYTVRMHLRTSNDQNMAWAQGPLPLFYGDRFGWQELTDKVTRIYRGLPPDEQKRAGILCLNYGEASAINFLGVGRGLPFAISEHNNYSLWGPHGETGEVMIVISNETLEAMRKTYQTVVIAGVMDQPYSMGYERWNIYLCHNRKTPLQTGWVERRQYI